MLSVRGLTTPLIGPIDLELKAGQCVAILGTSGSGKSLALRAIVDLDPNDGDVHLNGQSRDTMPANEWRQKVALVPAESGWWADHVRDHFCSTESSNNVSDIALASALKSVDLKDAADWEVGRLSTGERQRLAIARALQGQPEVVLLDEPTAALDPQATLMIEAIIARLCEDGIGVLLVTHDPEQAARIADEQWTLAKGLLTALDVNAT